jgi:hypothetical protein
MPLLGAGTRTLTLQITDPEVGDSVSASVYLTATNNQNAASVATGVVTAAQNSNGSPQTFALSISIPSNGTYYAWVVVYINGAAYAIFPQSSTLTVGQVTVTQGQWS